MSRVVMPRAYKARILSICALKPHLPHFPELRLERALPITRYLDGNVSLLSLHGFLTMAMAQVSLALPLRPCLE